MVIRSSVSVLAYQPSYRHDRKVVRFSCSGTLAGGVGAPGEEADGTRGGVHALSLSPLTSIRTSTFTFGDRTTNTPALIPMPHSTGRLSSLRNSILQPPPTQAGRCRKSGCGSEAAADFNYFPKD